MELKAVKKRVIGWRERVDLPDLGVVDLKVKVDTGARTSALHATGIRYIERAGSPAEVSFEIHAGGEGRRSRRVRAPLVEMRKVKSSLGHATIRPVIRTRLTIAGETWPIEVTLVNRDPMGFRMLLGRRAVAGRFLVHPNRSFIQSQPGK